MEDHYDNLAGLDSELRRVVAEMRDATRHANKVTIELIVAERRAGQILVAMDRQGRGRPEKGRARDQLPTLNELGVSKTQSDRWRLLAEIPEPVFGGLIQQAEDRAERD